MDRRTCLRSLGVVGIAGAAGCLDAIPGVGAERADGAILAQPDNPYNPETAHPIYGDEVPSFSVPNLEGEEITPETFEDERPFFITFIYTQCHDDACPALLQQLQYVQDAAQEGGYEDDVAFVAVTFDPDRDTPEVLREFADNFGVDHESDYWHFLRPEEYLEGRDMLNEKFSLGICRDDEDCSHLSDVHDEDDANDHDHNGEEDNADDEGDHDHYHFSHANLILLVNENGIVERAYPTRDTREDTEMFLDNPQELVDDLEAVLEG